jgi:hypothetical protein
MDDLLIQIKKANQDFAEKIGTLEHEIEEQLKATSKVFAAAEKDLKKLERELIDEIDSAVIDLVRPN